MYVNKVILMGRLTRDPEIKYTAANNTAVCTFSLAVPRRAKGEVDFINCQAWTKTAEFISKFFSKGNMIAVVGRIQNRSWDDKEGKKHTVTEVIVDETFFTGEKKADSQSVSQTQSRVETIDIGTDDELPF
jgi:single-strand DNA-binding protein